MDRGLRAIIDADDCRESITAVAAGAARLAGAWPIPAEHAAVAAGIASRLSAELAQVASWLWPPAEAGREVGELTGIPAGELAALRREWGHAYHVWWQAGEFHAMRRDNGAVCHCADAGQLVRELQADFAALPVLL